MNEKIKGKLNASELELKVKKKERKSRWQNKQIKMTSKTMIVVLLIYVLVHIILLQCNVDLSEFVCMFLFDDGSGLEISKSKIIA